MKLAFNILSFFLVVFLFSFSVRQDSALKTTIIGSWKLDKMEVPDDISEASKKEIDKANKMNEGMVFTFTSDGKYKAIKKTGQKTIQLGTGKYKVLENGKYLSLDGQKMQVVSSSNVQIRFSSPDKPIMVWAKVK